VPTAYELTDWGPTPRSGFVQPAPSSGRLVQNDLHHKAISTAQVAMDHLPIKGQNPAIFSYKFAELRSDMKLLLMTYYVQIQVLVKYHSDT
jgi:hypothetical protein